MRRMATISLVIVTYSVLALLLNSVANASSFSIYNVSSIEKQISPEITGEERVVIARIMETLEPEDRENVIYIAADGKVYANKPELKNDIIKWDKVKGNIYRDLKGNMRAFPEEETFASEGTRASGAGILAAGGPYRRIKSITGYSWFSAYVHLAGGEEIEIKQSLGDTAYVYTGGTGSTGVEVDAGLQYSQTYDNWAFYMKVGSGKPYTTTPRFKANQDAFIKFYVPSDEKVTLSVTAYDTSNTKKTISYTMDATGFNQNGSDCRIKRCTTIAQTNQNFSSGSWYENAHWYSCKIGTGSTSNHTWAKTDIYQTTSYPDSTHVVVN